MSIKIHKNKKPNNYFTEKIYAKHGNLYNYSIGNEEILSYRSKINIFCKIHGKFIQRLDYHINGSKCPRCSNSFYKTNDEFINEIKQVHGNRFDYSKVNYKGAKKSVIIICKIHGEFEVTPHNIIKYESKGCLKCLGREVFNTKDFITKGNRIHNNYYDYSEVVCKDAKTLVKIICPKHGCFEQTPDQHFNSLGCFKCYHARSKIEQEWLDSLNISHLKRNFYLKIEGKGIYVDGFDEKTNTIYEFYGDFYHGNPDYFDWLDTNPVSNINYCKLYRKTKERENLIKNAGFNLITIWESNYIESKGLKFHIEKLDISKKLSRRILLKKYYESLEGDEPVNDYSYLLNLP